MTSSSPSSLFAIAVRDEVWSRGELLESRLTHGQALQSDDHFDATDTGDERLIRACDEALSTAQSLAVALSEARVRLVVRAVREDSLETVDTTMTIGIGGITVVTTPIDAVADYEMLRVLVVKTPSEPLRSLPLVWRSGSAAVLLHEAVGHAREHGAPPVAWPSWLSVDVPLRHRRETFRDVPLPRMAHLVARQDGAPFALPAERIDVELVAGGTYDPITDIVTIDVAVSSAGPFSICRSRAEIAASLAGATGEPIRYPGVICSREGQELYVPSSAPLLITDALT